MTRGLAPVLAKFVILNLTSSAYSSLFAFSHIRKMFVDNVPVQLYRVGVPGIPEWRQVHADNSVATTVPLGTEASLASE